MVRFSGFRPEQTLRTHQAEFVTTAVQGADLIRDGKPQVAFVGRSNVGKSSLLNRLVGRRSLARISSRPGKTRAVNYFMVDDAFYFVDLPGYGYAKAAKQERQAWADLMDDYFNVTRPHPLVFQLVDSKVGATNLDIGAMDYFRHRGEPPTVIATKIDRLARSRRTRQLLAIRQALGIASEASVTPFSTKTGEGVKEVWKEIHGQLRATAERAN